MFFLEVSYSTSPAGTLLLQFKGNCCFVTHRVSTTGTQNDPNHFYFLSEPSKSRLILTPKWSFVPLMKDVLAVNALWK